jgi:hypothetical protein
MASNACEGCTCGRAQNNGLAAEEQRELARREARSFTAPSGYTEPTEGIEPAVPLRSKLWFNNPEDSEYLHACMRFVSAPQSSAPRLVLLLLTLLPITSYFLQVPRVDSLLTSPD